MILHAFSFGESIFTVLRVKSGQRVVEEDIHVGWPEVETLLLPSPVRLLTKKSLKFLYDNSETTEVRTIKLNQFPHPHANQVTAVTHSMCLSMSCIVTGFRKFLCSHHKISFCCRTIQVVYKFVPFVLHSHITKTELSEQEV
jgi:hypothetical protein